MLGRQAAAVTVRIPAGQLPGRRIERVGMCPAVVFGQGPADAAGPAGDGAVEELASRHRQMGDRHGVAARR
jgi:hypothetical protein